MQTIDERSAADYLRQTGRVDPDEPLDVRELAGGVSNMVLRVERPLRPGQAFVLKQARAQLRTQMPWFSSVERIWREADVLRACTRLIEHAPAAATAHFTATTPRILFEDRDHYLFAMTAAPEPNTVWKHDLLAGQTDPAIAVACGRLLATLHGESWGDQKLARLLGDGTLFDELRVDPYYRTLARVHADAREPIERLVASLAAHPRSLVHADFSPKNLLVFTGGMMMVDFETGHYGDAAFDLGFFSSHLVLKACLKAPRHDPYLALSETFWQAYLERMHARIDSSELGQLCERGILHFAGCGWARLDGKSPVDYLTDTARRDSMRAVCREVFGTQPSQWSDVVAICRRHFQSIV